MLPVSCWCTIYSSLKAAAITPYTRKNMTDVEFEQRVLNVLWKHQVATMPLHTEPIQPNSSSDLGDFWRMICKLPLAITLPFACILAGIFVILACELVHPDKVDLYYHLVITAISQAAALLIVGAFAVLLVALIASTFAPNYFYRSTRSTKKQL